MSRSSPLAGAGASVSTGGSSSGGRYIEEQDVTYSGEDVTYSGQHVVVEGGRISIACVLGVNDFLQWTLNDTPIVLGESGYTMIHGPGRQGYVVSRLTQARARSIHAGEYRCTGRAKEIHRVFVVSGKI
ncbi:hypothetical protein E2C01_052733 [Portunus trituberculatus]|uniref:Ig-like domain-containing protein n=1 Tax=Portunus trituberculatus TaxID=210409 RepID=A0A5B7GQ57_PORTR|nr:hypothetical protein [Portunus trituberculatus]